MKIAIFDSGIGGLSVLHRAVRRLPDAEFIYYADEAHVPYGEKTPAQIRGYLDEIIPWLTAQGADAIVIACNTATTAADMEYRRQFPIPIVGMEPALKLAIDTYGHLGKKVLVTATPVTIRGPKLAGLIERIDPHRCAELRMLPGLVRLAEAGNFDSPDVTDCLRRELGQIDPDEYSCLVFGCTHFCYFSRRFRDYLGDGIHFLDGSDGALRQLMRLLHVDPDTPEDGRVSQDVSYYYSGRPVTGEQMDFIRLCLRQLDDVREHCR